MTLWLVGEAPSRTSDPADPLGGRPIRRIAELAGLTERTVRDRTLRVNLLDQWPGHAGKGSGWPSREERAEAEDVAWRLLGVLCDGDRVIVCGYRAWSAFPFAPGHRDQFGQPFWRLPYLQWAPGGSEDRAWELAVLPHPSGVNRWWNEPRNLRAARRFLRRALREAR